MRTINIDGGAIRDAGSFHEVFKTVFGFPEFYGRNFDAWIDCMTYLDDDSAGMSSIRVHRGELLILAVYDASAFKEQCPKVWSDFLECVSFVNWRRMECGQMPILIISAHA